ncbi:MAG: peroxiredoxin [Bacteroidetes bacterium]|nr:peroxiredoxin [Bacteroidota bacterium]
MFLASESKSLLPVGSAAPDFSVAFGTGETFRLRDYSGKNNIVLFFYPKDFTSGCTAQVCSFRDNYSELLKSDAIVVGVSYDEEETHQAFIEKHLLPFPLVSDKDKSISRMYGTANRLGGLVLGAKRVTYVIDKRGIIRRVLHHELLIQKHIEGVLESLREIEKGVL